MVQSIIVDRGLKVLFLGLFCYLSGFFLLTPLEELNSAIFRYFLLIFVIFFPFPFPSLSLENFCRRPCFWYRAWGTAQLLDLQTFCPIIRKGQLTPTN